MQSERDHLLQTCRSLMPTAAGVVLATLQGHVVAHEHARVPDPRAVAAQAAAQRDPAAPTSTLVRRGRDLFFVLFVPHPGDQLPSCGAAALPA